MTTLHRREEPGWDEGWVYLVDAYRGIMEQFVRRALARSGRTGSVADEAADVLQSFLADCVEKGWLAKANPERGKFRAFVQTLLRRYVISYLRHSNAQKRRPSGGREVVVLLDSDIDLPLSRSEEAELRELDEGWVRVAVDRALERLQDENARHATIVRDLIATDGAGSADIALRLDVSPRQVAVLRHRARKRFSNFFVAELKATVGDGRDFVEEWEALAPYLP